MAFSSPRSNGHWQEREHTLREPVVKPDLLYDSQSAKYNITVAKRRLGLQTEIVKALVNHSQGNDVTEGYAAPVTVDDLREPAQKMASELFKLANPIDTHPKI